MILFLMMGWSMVVFVSISAYQKGKEEVASIMRECLDKAIDTDYRVVDPKLVSTFEVLPWFNCLTHLRCSASAPLSVRAVVPKSAQTNLIHVDENGDIKAIY